MNISERITWSKEREGFCFRIKAVQSSIFRTDPQDPLIVLTELTYSFSMQTIICPFRIILFKVSIETGIVVHSPEIRTGSLS